MTLRGIEKEPALTITEGAAQSPFNPDDYSEAMGGVASTYRCGGSFWWLNLSYSPVRTEII